MHGFPLFYLTLILVMEGLRFLPALAFVPGSLLSRYIVLLQDTLSGKFFLSHGLLHSPEFRLILVDV
jgi:hypothetical protein